MLPSGAAQTTQTSRTTGSRRGRSASSNAGLYDLRCSCSSVLHFFACVELLFYAPWRTPQSFPTHASPSFDKTQASSGSRPSSSPALSCVITNGSSDENESTDCLHVSALKGLLHLRKKSHHFVGSHNNSNSYGTVSITFGRRPNPDKKTIYQVFAILRTRYGSDQCGWGWSLWSFKGSWIGVFVYLGTPPYCFWAPLHNSSNSSMDS